eukprot:GEMP01082834.1.p1 GENE.GEMP01082834.1~~GEMP01082834.1.p1  ORF type:complete len:205 (+),score=46.96 GEMP01082834.1:327-941(+)
MLGNAEPIRALATLDDLYTKLTVQDHTQHFALSDRYFVTNALLTVVSEKIRKKRKKLFTKLQNFVEEKTKTKTKIIIQSEFVNDDVKILIQRAFNQPKTGVAELDNMLANLNSLADEIEKKIQTEQKDNDLTCGNRRRLRGPGRVLNECVAPDRSPGWSTAAIFAALALFCSAALFAIGAICWVARQQPNGETEADEGMDDAGF